MDKGLVQPAPAVEAQDSKVPKVKKEVGPLREVEGKSREPPSLRQGVREGEAELGEDPEVQLPPVPATERPVEPVTDSEEEVPDVGAHDVPVDDPVHHAADDDDDPNAPFPVRPARHPPAGRRRRVARTQLQRLQTHLAAERHVRPRLRRRRRRGTVAPMAPSVVRTGQLADAAAALRPVAQDRHVKPVPRVLREPLREDE